MKDIVISSKKIQKSIDKELNVMFGENVPPKVRVVVYREFVKWFQEDIDVLLSNIDHQVNSIVQSRFSLDEVFPKERG